ncbi:thiolase family protein [Frankia sp. AiPs1]|uniref:thiolase family protein n=1 Tax=Frankia sp. AiPs1 TaxID=573493 RepID=UPI00204413A0|nr:thiolase family protein [Frankia sp. AiPs1]MCM3920355.1 thiolase family protein [Frankia sp. AiPs1]
MSANQGPPVYISGSAQEIVGRGRPAPAYLNLLAAAAADAVADAGLDRAAIDGLVLSSSIPQPFERNPAEVAEYLGLGAAYTAMAPYGGRPATDVLHLARSAVRAGLATNVLVLSADTFASTLGLEGAIDLYMKSFDASYERPFGPLIPTAFALMAARHVHDYGTSMEQLARVAVSIRKHGLLNPHTEVSGELTVRSVVDDVLVSTPLTRSMLALISTGGAQGFVVTRERVDRRSVALLGYGEASAFMSLSQAPSLVHFAHIRRAADLALRQAGAELTDVDFVQFYDPATIVPLILLESIGFCGPGEGGAFVEDGAIEIGGRLPMNTHGGTLAFRHPGMGAALDSVVEAVTQLRGEAGPRQVRDAGLGLVHGQGSWLANNGFLILGRS